MSQCAAKIAGRYLNKVYRGDIILSQEEIDTLWRVWLAGQENRVHTGSQQNTNMEKWIDASLEDFDCF